MSDLRQPFFISVEKNVSNAEEYEIVREKLSHYKHRQARTQAFYNDMEFLRNKALYIRSKGMDDLENHLKEFEANFKEHNGKVVWALNEEDAVAAILHILKSVNAKKVIATHSAAIGEIYLKEQLPDYMTLVETSFQDFLTQSIDDENFDVFRASHKELVDKLSETFETKIDPRPKHLINFVCGKIRNHFFDADAVITGANFLVADAGCVSLSENEGNISRACAFPKVHIVVAGYDKIIPSIKEIETFWTLFAASGDGTLLTAYNSLIFGPRTKSESDGPEAMFIIIIDNGRNAVLERSEQRKALHCIRCNACKRYCSVWQTIGEKAYHAPYTGPIGAVLMPLMRDSKRYHYMTYAASISTKPQQHCPIKIPLYELTLYNRALFVKEGRNGKSLIWNYLFKKSQSLSIKHKTMNFGNKKSQQMLMLLLIKKSWGTRRMFPEFAKKSFNEIYRINHPQQED